MTHSWDLFLGENYQITSEVSERKIVYYTSASGPGVFQANISNYYASGKYPLDEVEKHGQARYAFYPEKG